MKRPERETMGRGSSLGQKRVFFLLLTFKFGLKINKNLKEWIWRDPNPKKEDFKKSEGYFCNYMETREIRISDRI